jgi:glycosyltransferase involved in cell wall biosynthesis
LGKKDTQIRVPWKNMPPDVSVFIPARNKAGNIIPLLKSIARTFNEHEIDGEVVVVDDGSTDATRAEALAGRELMRQGVKLGNIALIDPEAAGHR